MNIPDDIMSNMHTEINQAILHDEIVQAKILREESLVLFEAFCDPNEDAEKNTEAHLQLLGKLKDFERDLINFEILDFLYANIARTALNSIKLDVAMQYAQAGIEANQKNNDSTGVDGNRKILLDMACLIGAHKEALKLIEKHPEIAEPDVQSALQNSSSKNDDVFQDLLLSKKRPESLSIRLNEGLMASEKAIRTIMRQMGVSRAVALKYKKTAEEQIGFN